jgi:hypothetical protein
MNTVELFLLINTGLLLSLVWKVHTMDVVMLELIEEKND